MVWGSQARKVMGLRRVNSMEIENPWLDFFRGVGSAASHNPMTMPPPPSPAEETQGDWGKVQGRGWVCTTAKPRPATTPPPKKPPPGRAPRHLDNPTAGQSDNPTVRQSDWHGSCYARGGAVHHNGAGRARGGRYQVGAGERVRNISTFSHSGG